MASGHVPIAEWTVAEGDFGDNGKARRGQPPSGRPVFSLVHGGKMAEEKRWWRWRLDRIAETARHVGVALVVTGVVSLFLDPAVGRGATAAICVGLACLSYGWTRQEGAWTKIR